LFIRDDTVVCRMLVISPKTSEDIQRPCIKWGGYSYGGTQLCSDPPTGFILYFPRT